MLSILIVSYNVRNLILDCLVSIYETVKNIPFEVIVVDNASSDGTPEVIKEKFPQCQCIVNQTNKGFAFANNQGFEKAKGEIILLLNPDTKVLPDSIEKMYRFLEENPYVGGVSCRILYPDGRLQKSISKFPTVFENLLIALYLQTLFLSHWKRKTYYRTSPFEIEVPLGACFMIRKSALEGEMLFDPKFFIYAEEMDLAFRLKQKGHPIFFLPQAEIIHYSEQSTQQNRIPMFFELQKSKLLFYKLHYPPKKANALALSLWLCLFSRWISAILLFPIWGKRRIRLFQEGIIKFPKLWKAIGEKSI